MFGVKDCIDICLSIYSVYKTVVQNKALCAQLKETVQYCESLLTRQQQQQQHQCSFITGSSIGVTAEDTFQSLHDALSLGQAYIIKYTEKKIGRSIIRALNITDDRFHFNECKERIDGCIARLPIVQIMDQDERFVIAEKRRISEFTELKRVINISMEDILNHAHDNSQAVVDIMKEFRQDLHQFVTNEAVSMFRLNTEEISSLQVDVNDKLAILDARQKEILDILRGMECMYVCIS